MSAEKMAVIEARQNQLERSVESMVGSNKELTRELSKLAIAINDSVSQQKHVSESLSRAYTRMDKTDERLGDIERTQISYKPWIDLIKSINGRVWFMLISVMFTAVASIGGIVAMSQGVS